MFQLPGRCCLLVLASAVLACAQTEELVPPSKLRPSDATRFYPELVRLHEDGMEEIRAILRTDPKRAHYADAVTRELLRKLPADGDCFARLLTGTSQPVQEWAMRTMGEYTGDKTAALPRLLDIVSDRNEFEAHRATAARVIGTTRMNAETVALLAQQLPGAGQELQIILLEVVATSGRTGLGVLPELKRYLAAPEAGVQFHAFRAIHQIERMSGQDGVDFGEAYANAKKLARGEDGTQATNLAVAVLKAPNTPGYLTCMALLSLATAAPSPPEATDVVLRKVGHFDSFVSELAANVLRKVRHFGTPDVAALKRGLLSSNATVRLQSMLEIREIGPSAGNVIDPLIAALRRAAREGANPRETGACLDALRSMGTNGAPAARLMVELLDEQSPIYRNAQKHEVHRLRGFLLATLAEVTVPENALPFIVGALANSDQRSAVEFAGAARAAGALETRARVAVPFLVRALEERIDDDLITFEKFDSHGVPGNGEYTTCQIEALRALRRIGPTDEPAARAVRAFLEQPIPVLNAATLYQRIPDLRQEATQTLAAIEVTNGAEH